MLRAFVFVMACLVPLACASDDGASDHASGGPGGAGGATAAASTSSAGGASGASSGNGGGATTAAGGAGNGGRSGDGDASGDRDAAVSGDTGGAATSDAGDASIADDARIRDAGGEGDGSPGGDSLPGKPWIHLCPKTDTHEQCCAFLCSCLTTVCADSPLDKPGIDNCMSNCSRLTDMAMRCRVYHCYESLNPRVPQDHVSHCGHASGRVPGGGCPAEVYGP
jgi:hypothetical protein